MNIKRLVPDTITSCNLLCGALAVFLATEGAFLYAFLFILLGAFFDFFDGMSARLLKVPSALGIQSTKVQSTKYKNNYLFHISILRYFLTKFL